MSSKLPFIYKEVKKIATLLNMEYGVSIKASMESCDSIHTFDRSQHQISFNDINELVSMYELVAKAKNNEIAGYDLNNIDIENEMTEEYLHLFENISSLLSTYWAYELLNKAISNKQMTNELKNIQDAYSENLKAKDADVISSMRKYLILERHDMVEQSENTSLMIDKISDFTKKYGSKEPSIHNIVSYFNSFGFAVKAYMRPDSSVALIDM